MPREKKRAPILLPPGAGRAYRMGPVHAVFKADGDETRGRYSISEWWLEPYTRGPGAHTHEEDDVFFVIEGTMSFFVGGAWIDAPKGSLVIAPGGTAITLSSAQPGDTNSITEPTKVVPLTTKATGLGPQFSHNFAPYSVTVLVISTR